MSFGLVACVLGLVLALCFAYEFLVSRKPLTVLAGPQQVAGWWWPQPLPTSSAPLPGGQC